MEYENITNLLVTTSDNAPRFFTKNGYKFMISQVVLKIDRN